jgi:hypothetical protein
MERRHDRAPRVSENRASSRDTTDIAQGDLNARDNDCYDTGHLRNRDERVDLFGRTGKIFSTVTTADTDTGGNTDRYANADTDREDRAQKPDSDPNTNSRRL